ncbi:MULTISPECIES: hypothetical protein [unclassified Clostridium]|uniref:hypothetical protein n=1 Tax=unclassified Clostridium TaxID=2614128 RepID=UPI0002973217|nr:MULTISPECIES: hypothetical protein [unclassified Clostridium]EKQ56266.1 MAG: hypothetical protein A370_02022 [Clostridium sp. Maddingley MBC34-26]
MAIDLIKEYLVGIGFQIDENSFNQTKSSMDDADKTITKFNKNSQEGFSNTNDVLKDLFSLLQTSSGTIGKLFPELQGPFKGLIGNLNLIKKLYSDLTNTKEPQKPNIKNEKPKPNSKTDFKAKSQQESHFTPANTTVTNKNPISKSLQVMPQNKELADSSKNLVDVVLDAKDAAKGLAEEGGNAFKLFSAGALGPIAAVVAGVAAVTLAVRGLAKFLNGLANQDIEYEKLSRQLWTTKENAKEVDMALKTLGVSMQDLWLSPTLLKQFNQLRQDSKALKLPKEYTDNLKVVQGIGLEFSRLRQLGQLAFQWIGNYILKYAAGPLKDIKAALHDFNDSLIKNIKPIAAVIGTSIGLLIKIIAVIIKVGTIFFKVLFPIVDLIKLIGSAFEKLPESTKKSIKDIISILIILTNPLLLIIGLIDDLMTYFKGGKSLTGTFIDKFNKELDGSGKKIKSVIDYFKNLKKEILNSDFVKWIESVGNSLGKKIKDIKNGDFKDLLGDISIKVKDFSNPNMNKVVSNYATSNTSNTSNTTTTTQNSHNTVTNENKVYVYGTDSNSTGKAVKNNLTGITVRNLQGGY